MKFGNQSGNVQEVELVQVPNGLDESIGDNEFGIDTSSGTVGEGNCDGSRTSVASTSWGRS